LGAGLAISNPAISQDVKTTNIVKPTYTTTPYDSTTNYVSAVLNNFKKFEVTNIVNFLHLQKNKFVKERKCLLQDTFRHFNCNIF
jgi:hypothetical protein